MIRRTMHLLLTFYTTADAMAVERICKSRGIPGRIIPVPRSITADCGMAWRTDLDQRQAMEELTADMDLAGIYELEC